jgi:hypothetical protein
MRRLAPLVLAAATALVLLAGLAPGAGSRAPARRMLGILAVPGVQHRTLAAPPALSYHGGPVVHGNTGYAVFWSPPGYAMPQPTIDAVSQFFQDVQASSKDSAYAVLGQYFDTTGPAQTSTPFGGAIVVNDALPQKQCTDTPSVPVDAPLTTCVNATTVESEIDHAVQTHGLAQAKPIVFFFLPPGVGMCSDDGRACAYSDFAAFHSMTQGGALYGFFPYFAATPYEAMAHEHAEILSDPLGNAWYTDDQDESELADLCQQHPSLQTIGSGSYSISPLWSDASGGCSIGPQPASSPLTVRVRGKAKGGVTASFSGMALRCTTQAAAQGCVTVVRRGAQVTLAPTPEDGFAFASWGAQTPCAPKTKARCTFTKGAAGATVTASFAVSHADEVYLLSVDVTGKGTVVLPSGHRCRTSCVERVTGDPFTVHAVPDKGWKLVRLKDDTRHCGKQPRCTLQLRDSDNVFATFARA